jgi:hypothetical protein
MWTLARDIASASRRTNGVRAPWAVDPLTRKVYVHSVTALLEPEEAARLRSAFAERHAEFVGPPLSDGGRAVLPLLTVLDVDEAEAALHALPTALQERLTAMSPVRYLADVRAPLIVLLHDRDDPVIPVSESRQLRDALAGRSGLHYTEFTVFKHLDPTKGKPAAIPLARELVRFGQAIYPLFRRAVSPTEPRLTGHPYPQNPPGHGSGCAVALPDLNQPGCLVRRTRRAISRFSIRRRRSASENLRNNQGLRCESLAMGWRLLECASRFPWRFLPDERELHGTARMSISSVARSAARVSHQLTPVAARCSSGEQPVEILLAERFVDVEMVEMDVAGARPTRNQTVAWIAPITGSARLPGRAEAMNGGLLHQS